MKRIDQTLCGSLFGDTLAKRFLESRKQTKLTQQMAAKHIGISAGQLGRIERGGVAMVAEPSTLVRAARVYGVPQVWLYAGAAAGSRFIPDWYSVQPIKQAA